MLGYRKYSKTYVDNQASFSPSIYFRYYVRVKYFSILTEMPLGPRFAMQINDWFLYEGNSGI